jgi:hypothetical protein
MNKPYSIEEIKRITVPIAKQYGVKKLALFGSYARGEQKEDSDIDFLIEKGEITDLFVYYGFVHLLEDNLGVNVDVLTYDSLDNSLINKENINEVVLYE